MVLSIIGNMVSFIYIDGERYKSDPIIHGHFKGVSDLDWDYSKKVLYTNSSDQTTRAYGLWKKNSNSY
jgi:hypothetical protein